MAHCINSILTFTNPRFNDAIFLNALFDKSIARPYFLNEPVSLAHTITLLPLARLVTLYQRFNILRLGKAQVNLFSLNFSPFRVYPPHFHTMLSLPYQEALPSMAGCNCAWHRPGDRIAHNIAPRQAIQADLRHARVLCRIWL